MDLGFFLKELLIICEIIVKFSIGIVVLGAIATTDNVVVPWVIFIGTIYWVYSSGIKKLLFYEALVSFRDKKRKQ